jgi:hypothetical protein
MMREFSSLFFRNDERSRTKKGRPRGGFRDGKYKNLLAPPCLGEALKRGPSFIVRFS